MRIRSAEWLLWEPGYIKVVTAAQMRELDKQATEQYGISSLLLMENAGQAVAETAKGLLGDPRGREVVIVCGQGNNGGDGFVAARHLANAGAIVNIAYFGDRSKAKGDALTNIEIAEKMDLWIHHNPGEDFWGRFWVDCDLVIDALLGTGAKGELKEPLNQVMFEMWRLAQTASCPTLSVDIPSGIDADTGDSVGERHCNADVTVTFALPKLGLFSQVGIDSVGELVIADIGIPLRALEDNEARTYLLTGPSIPELDVVCCSVESPRFASSHKGDYGHVAIIAGSVGMTGAATLAAEGALRIGTGLVMLAVPESLNDIMEVKLTEAMTIPVPQGKARAFGMASLPKVLEIIEKRDAAVIGPGFGRDDDTVHFALELIAKLDKPAILDADALYAISKDLSVLKKCKAPLVITPHPGEMATLLGTSVAEVQSNRLETARAFAKEHGVTVVLKGAGTVVAEPNGEAYINTTGTPGMATGGTGDVLSGMIGGLLAQKVKPCGAACSAVYLHGRAGEIAAEALGEAAMIASDVADRIGEAILGLDQ